MARPLRHDAPGTRWHTINRGTAKRPVFESSRDVRLFISLLEKAVQGGLLIVEAFVVMTTHFHLLAASPAGRLAEAMHLVQNTFARTFNRSRRRDGPLFRGRYRAREITTETYRQNVLLYIDRNPVVAGLVECPTRYPHGSAWHYARADGPQWLDRAWVESAIVEWTSSDMFEPSGYAQAHAAMAEGGRYELVEARIERGGPADDPWDDLVRAAPSSVQSWMQYKTKLADGTEPGMVVLRPETISSVIRARELDGSTADIVEAGLLRLLAAATFEEIGVRMHSSYSAARRDAMRFTKVLPGDASIAVLAASIVTDAFTLDFPRLPRHADTPRRLLSPRGVALVGDQPRGE